MTAHTSADVIELRASGMPHIDDVLRRLDNEAMFEQLLTRTGRMAELGTEAGDFKLDWVDGVRNALKQQAWLRAAAEEATAILAAGIKHIIWSGMGGSVQTVYCLKRMGYLDLPTLSIHPLDSTDPASLNRTLTDIAALDGLPPEALKDVAVLRTLLQTTMMIGVSMGMTSEEPITHLDWFDGLLKQANVDNPGSHIQVMTLPGSYLDDFARSRGSRMVPIQLNSENHTPGRMSAPATRVFLRPVALAIAASNGNNLDETQARLAAIFMRAERLGGPEGTPSRHPFVRLGTMIAQQTAFEGRNKVVLELPAQWDGFGPWLEQLVEESLGKGGKGFLIFYQQDTATLAQRDDVLVLRLNPAGAVLAGEPTTCPEFGAVLDIPIDTAIEPTGLAELAALMLGFQFAVATVGFLHDIVFVGQPAVEGYKRYARELRDGAQPISFGDPGALYASDGRLTLNAQSLERARLLSPADVERVAALRGWDLDQPAALLAAVLTVARGGGWFRYLDVTFNGDITDAVHEILLTAQAELALGVLGMPCKIRTGPSDYHSTEQGETDGPFELVSIRIVALQHDVPMAGTYHDTFLLAQARGTWQAMEDAGRWIVMVTIPDTSEESLAALRALVVDTAGRLREGS